LLDQETIVVVSSEHQPLASHASTPWAGRLADDCHPLRMLA
jgi:hypothetical protein